MIIPLGKKYSLLLYALRPLITWFKTWHWYSVFRWKNPVIFTKSYRVRVNSKLIDAGALTFGYRKEIR